MLVAAAVCPHPPLLVPELASGAAGELDALRDACDAAIRDLLAPGAPVHVVGAAGPAVLRSSSTRPWGVDVALASAPLPLALLIGEWLLRRAGANVEERHEVPPDAPPAACSALGARLVADSDVALLVMGDGTARRSEKAPGWIDERAEAYDAAAAAALGGGDADALLALDPGLGAALLATGRAAWQVLAGAAQGTRFDAEVTYDEAPYGVGYLVARWRRGGEAER